MAGIGQQAAIGRDQILDALCRLDWHHHTLLLNHVSRRASLIQGIALLTLYVRSFFSALQDDSARADALVEELRRRIRRGGARLAGGALALPSDELAGHLAVCTGVFSCCVGLSFERMIHHHVFLQARNLMSCSIRLNTIGPYLAHRLLASDLRPLVERIAASVSFIRSSHGWISSTCPLSRSAATRFRAYSERR